MAEEGKMDCNPNLYLVILFVVVVLVYQLTEIHYFVRIFVCFVRARYLKSKLHILGTAEYDSRCTTTDVDYLLFHMNNGRYLRELDFARTDFFQRTGLWSEIRGRGGQVYMSASSARYRRFIRLFAAFRVQTRIVYWDEETLYTEHRFVTPDDGFVRAIIYGQQKVVQCDLQKVMDELLSRWADKVEVPPKPKCPEEIRLWIESSRVSSLKLRTKS